MSLSDWCLNTGTMTGVTFQAITTDQITNYTFTSSTSSPLKQPSSTGVTANSQTPVFSADTLLTGPARSADLAENVKVVRIDSQRKRLVEEGHLKAPIPLPIGKVMYMGREMDNCQSNTSFSWNVHCGITLLLFYKCCVILCKGFNNKRKYQRENDLLLSIIIRRV
jgi:hypothetical protein